MLFDRGTNKCFDKDIAEYLDKYHNKRIHAAPTQLPHSSNQRLRRPHASSHAPTTTPPPCHLHASPTPSRRLPSAAATQHPHRLHTATTPQQRSRNVIFTLLHAALTPSSRPAARSSHAALTPAEHILHAACTPLAHRRKAAAKPLMLVASHRPNAPITQLHAAAHYHPPLRLTQRPHTAATPPQSRPYAAARRLYAAARSGHTAVTPPSCRYTPNAAVHCPHAPLRRTQRPHADATPLSRRPHAAARRARTALVLAPPPRHT